MTAETPALSEGWPCDDYLPPLTCYTVPRRKTIICEGCRAAFPNGPEMQALYVAAREGHDCATCEACRHDGNRCCGCYDGACCQLWTNGLSQAERWRLDNLIHRRLFTSDGARLEAVCDAVLDILAARLSGQDTALAAVRGLLAAYGDDVEGGRGEFLVYQLRAALAAAPTDGERQP